MIIIIMINSESYLNYKREGGEKRIILNMNNPEYEYKILCFLYNANQQNNNIITVTGYYNGNSYSLSDRFRSTIGRLLYDSRKF